MIKTNNLEKTLKEVLEIHDVVMINGAPGIGKSEIAYQVCQELGMKLLEIRLYEMGDAACGYAMLKSELTQFTKPEWFYRAEKEKPDVIFFDDFHSVPNQIQKFFYRFLTDRMIHHYRLNYNPKVVIAGNFDIESAGAALIESPVMGRVEIMIDYEPNIDTFLEWASKHPERIDTRVYAFLKINPDLLYTKDPEPSSKYPSPRNWEHLSKNIKVFNSPKYAPGIVGSRPGSIFQDFWDKLNVKIDEILSSPIPSDLNKKVINAIVLGSEFAHAVENKNRMRLIEDIMDYVMKLDPETSVLFGKQALQASKKDNAWIINYWSNNFPEFINRMQETYDAILTLKNKKS